MDTKFQQIYGEMKRIADDEGFELTPTAEKIAMFRVKANIPMDECPCERGKDKGRGCLGRVCLKELLEKGICHCRAYKRKDI